MGPFPRSAIAARRKPPGPVTPREIARLIEKWYRSRSVAAGWAKRSRLGPPDFKRGPAVVQLQLDWDGPLPPRVGPRCASPVVPVSHGRRHGHADPAQRVGGRGVVRGDP